MPGAKIVHPGRLPGRVLAKSAPGDETVMMRHLAEELVVEQKKITVRPYTRTQRKPGIRAEMLAGLPKEIEEYIIPEGETCSKCGGDFKVVGQRVVRTEVDFGPLQN